VTAELAYYSPGKTKNPHDIKRTPGGSSSGSAAAVASHMVPLAVGSQTNGSVIRPASFCGVVGYKPSKGYISRHLVLQVSQTLDQVGIFSNSIEDAALISEQLIGHDKQDPDTTLNPKPKLLAASKQKPPAEPILAYIKLPFMDKLEDDAKEGFKEIKKIMEDPMNYEPPRKPTARKITPPPSDCTGKVTSMKKSDINSASRTECLKDLEAMGMGISIHKKAS